MKRNIINIDESKCNGCAQCITACAEGALQLVNGKAKLVKEIFCDGFGDCLGECPTGALTIEVREAPDFDYAQTKGHVRNERGEAGLQQLETAAQKHGAPSEHRPSADSGEGCPGMKMRFTPKPAAGVDAAIATDAAKASAGRSELEQWPVQIHLVQPGAPFFRGRELLVLSTCAPVASADIHGQFIRGRGVVVGCPKLDNTEGYVDKLAAILKDKSIPGVLVVRMEVPCCGRLTKIVQNAVRQSGRHDLRVEEVQIGLDGTIKTPSRIE
ncbi:MAG: 4Fe-4S ferredoxin [Verrucomicrobia bacterium]|nr:4Fe-4S ferredoxin [Verrucomicrobiota bacterium]MBU1733804.1 4Fe-4S ferredoxin [Verrucomicrobiota bacterium]MBU1856166.1 4Fe-4S ferredoxin [Verrucomicrobiota bacterium]